MMTITSMPSAGVLRIRALEEAGAVTVAGRSADFDFAMNVEGGGGTRPLAAAEPLPIYSIPISTLAEAENPLDEAAQHGWRVLTEDGAGKRLVDLKGADADAMPSVVRGARSAAMLEKAGEVAVQTAPSEVSYQARVLDLSKVGMSLLWLHAHGDEEDRFYSLTDEPREMFPAEVIDAARKSAQRRLEATDPASEQGGAPPDGERSSVERGG
jgi:hypothetical protein